MSRGDELLAEIARAYEGLEDPASFPDRQALERYRGELLERSAPQADLLLATAAEPLTVLEVACGNGRLLIELARRGALCSGYGSDIAASRIRFARDWARDIGAESLEFHIENLLTAAMPVTSFDAALCITGALAYFEPSAPGRGSEVVARLHDALVPGGLLVLELYPHPEYREMLAATGRARVWHELPEGDPWRFYLSDLHLDGDVLTHTKTFVHRHDNRIDEGRRERLFLYTAESVTALLHDAGFESVRLLDGWTDRPYSGGEVMVATARRRELRRRRAAVTPSPR